MLITQMAQSWLRLQRAHDAEERYFQAHDVLDAIANDFEKYKAITRMVTDCERAWRHAMLHLEKAQRQRQQTGGFSPNARRHPEPEPAIAARPVTAWPADTPASGPAAREPLSPQQPKTSAAGTG